jgi:hypothetical protein
MEKKIMIVSLLFATFSCKQEAPKEAELVPVSETAVVEVDSMPGKKGEYVVTEEVFWVLQEEPENHFEKANQHYAKKELSIAGKEIKKASAYLGMEINKVDEKGKAPLQAAKGKLDSLSTRLEKGEKVKESELKSAFHKVNLALYKTYINQSDKIGGDYEQDREMIGLYLDAALEKAENAEKWSGKKLDEQSLTTIKEGKVLSQRFKTDLKGDNESIKKEWAAFKTKVRDLDIKLEGNTDL